MSPRQELREARNEPRQGFDLYLTSSRDQAESYVRERYRGQEEARYGLLASSKARLSDYGIYADWQATRRLRVGPWFYDAPGEPLSCCRLRDTVTEFQCQGLELDYPIVCWGQDLIWDGRAWRSPVCRGEPRPATRTSCASTATAYS